jgi:hypothetical protein
MMEKNDSFLGCLEEPLDFLLIHCHYFLSLNVFIIYHFKP